ncbi:MAG: hypothetical protein IT319_10670 [Anaerolineae bacterium]|nr:hypothetical protein [Anaerolineae bacterium]
MPPTPIAKDALFAALPSPAQADRLPEIRARMRESGKKIVVLDDDPTGTQTVHALPVLTRWDDATLAAEFGSDATCFYILTNSRSLSPDQAYTLSREIGAALRRASEQTGRDFVVVSRSDSTLRGHFPAEMDALAAGLDTEVDGWIVLPAFIEGGRFTIQGIHYVQEGDQLIPAGETPFARDAAFGYHASDLREWVAEKTGGRIPARAIETISIDDLRVGGAQAVCATLMRLVSGGVCAVDAAAYADLETFVLGLLDAEAQGKRFLYRTAASFVRVRAGIEPRPLLTAADLKLDAGRGGLTIVGSYVPKTSAQLEQVARLDGIEPVSVDAELLADESLRVREIERVTTQVDQLLLTDKTVVVSTTRAYVAGDDPVSSLRIGQRISDGLVAILRGLSVRPRYLIAKGGITSSDLASKGLDVGRAWVLGQILPGVPVWALGAESRLPGLPYVVFPGNVGSETALAEIIVAFRKG